MNFKITELHDLKRNLEKKISDHKFVVKKIIDQKDRGCFREPPKKNEKVGLFKKKQFEDCYFKAQNRVKALEKSLIETNHMIREQENAERSRIQREKQEKRLKEKQDAQNAKTQK